MMIGPAPMIRMLLMSVRFGIKLSDAGFCVRDDCSRRPGARALRGRGGGGGSGRGRAPALLRLDQRDKAIEQIGDIVRSRRGFRMPLEAERGFVGQGKTLERAVEKRGMR